MRRRLVSEGGRHIKERGVQGAGVDGIARGLGLSGAALYSHFASKEEFLRTILGEELGATARRFLSANATVDQLLARYLSLAHVRAPAAGCALPAVTSDVARGSEELRQAFSHGFSEVVAALEQKLGGREAALGAIAAAVGAVAIARALPDDAAAAELLDSTRRLLSEGLGKGALTGGPVEQLEDENPRPRPARKRSPATRSSPRRAPR
ncbi:TetR/AcrR family transcriptional regulator [Corallococcus exiguus]|uniref:TetR/AcrR family transcriptional regulator n=1 Tax=Corallococcus exiguus TaxID=83462 RepID=UPI00155F9BB3|nr:TetR/AcrR family transcriptional regulator [Corallococcus exiguus]NRD42937.1 TetR/AcrR family transcriptional regulator [Corallococcus exiguus]